MEIDEAVSVTFPLKGEWTALHTPAERVPSHGTDYFGQRYAFDFARLLGPYKKAYRKPIWHHLLGRVRVEDCYGWGEPVLAPFDGEVVAVGDGYRDRERLNLLWDLLRTSFFAQDATPEDYRPLAGNYILLEGRPGVALLAHLRLGSVRARVGQLVGEGEPLASVGNSGNSTTPHLHFHIMSGRDPFKAEGLPCKFRRYERLRDGIWEEVYDSIPGALEPIRVS
jgi:Peptidase family M23